MCGIVGCKTDEEGLSVINGLKRLEYRGYDSWGIAIQAGQSLRIIKKVGKIGEFSESKCLPKSCCAIAHTRWATHGGVTEVNAHPHTDCNSKIAVVHNGIIENFGELKRKLEKKGHVFKSETDTEVIPHLVEEYFKKLCFKEACRKAVQELKGSYAVLILCKNRIAAAKNESPLVIGLSKGRIILASDTSAFDKEITTAIFLEDDDFALIDKDLEISSISTGKKVDRKTVVLDLSNLQAERGNFPHYMLKEIFEQNVAFRRTLRQDRESVKRLATAINKCKEIYLVACGTAYHASLLASYLFSKIARKNVQVVLASEFEIYNDFITKYSLVIPVSQSGETADVLAAVKSARKKGARVASIVNVPGSTLTRMSDSYLLTKAGPEIAVASTKAFTSQVGLLTLVAYACAGKFKEGKLALAKAAGKLAVKPDYMDQIGRLSFLANKNHLFTIGRSTNFPVALEAALKIKEISYIHAEGFAGGELKHGTLALIEKGTPCIAFIAEDETKADILGNVMEVKARGGTIIGISSKKEKIFDYHINIPGDGILTPLVGVVPAQLLAYKLAIWKNLDPDKPRNLAKSVTVK